MDQIHFAQETAPPLRTVYGSVMNQAFDWQRLDAALSAAPYNAPPQAPVLYIKPANTFAPQGRALALPGQATRLYVTPQIGLIYVGSQRWMLCVFHEASLEQPNWFRPPVKFNAHDHSLSFCRNGFLLIGDLDSVINRTTIISSHTNSSLQSQSGDRTTSSRSMRLSAASFVAQVSSFISFEVGDALMFGANHEPFEAQLGDVIQSELSGLGSCLNLTSSVVQA
jgi:5-oxopent-3-ene-1,2,5-tricarboxylate decarboxylase / 2-hydroxyhepta-2,4-diene-1,7-dioate isomerase